MYKVVQIPSFGFNKNGKFDLIILNSNLTKANFFMLSKGELTKIFNFSILLSTCINNISSLFISELNFSSTSKDAHQWSGTIPTKNVYTGYIVNCDQTKLKLDVEYNYSNPNSLLDYRDELLPNVNLILFFIYLLFFIIWCLNGYFFSSFRIPIHTIFCIHPLFKITTLMLMRSVWNDKKKIENPPMIKEIIAHICDFINYGLLMSIITYVSAGLCIYRERFKFNDHVEVLFSSFMITMCLILFPFIQNIIQLFIVLIVTGFGALWHIQKDTIFLIISSKIREELKDQQLIDAKIKLSQKYVISSLICLISTVFLYSILLSIDFPFIISLIALEIGLVIENIINLRFFLFRNNYAGEKIIDTQKNSNKIKRVHLKQMITPFGTNYAFFEQKYT